MLKKSPIFLLMFSAISMADDNSTYIPVSDETPAGFELISEELSMSDIYIDGAYVGTTSIGTKSERFSKKIPKDVANIIKKNANKNGEIFNSIDYVITKNARSGEINVWRKKNKLKRERLTSTPTLRMNVNGVTQHQGGVGNQTYHFDNSFKNGSHGASFDVSQYDESTQIRSANYEYDTGSSTWSTGILPNNNVDTGISGASSVIGLRVNYNDSVTGERAPIHIFLKDTAKIYIMRGPQLLNNISLPAGNHDIDVSELPTGNYSVKLKIEYLNGEIEEKSAYLSQLQREGKAWSLSEITFGATSRENIGDQSPSHYSSFVGVDLYGFQGENYSSAVQFAIANEKISISPSFRFENKDFNLISQAKLKSGGEWWYTNRLNIRNENHQTYIEQTGFDYENREDNITSINHNHEILDGSLTLSAYHQKSTNVGTSFQVAYSRWIPFGSLGRGTITASANFSDETTWQLKFSYGLSSFENNLNYRFSATRSSEQGSWSQHTVANQLSYKEGYLNTQAYKTFSEGGQESYAFSGNLSDSRYGSLEMQTGQSSKGSEAYVNTRFKGGLLYDGTSLYSTGTNNATTGAIVDLTSSPEGNYNLYVDQALKTLKGGELHIVPLNAGQRYSLSLSNSDTQGVAVLGETTTVLLKKGEIIRPNWRVAKVSYIIGSIIVNGKPFANQLVRTEISEGYTDENGFIAIESPRDSRLIKTQGAVCTLTPEQNFLTIGENSCKLTNQKL